jgi:hypothetical protein
MWESVYNVEILQCFLVKQLQALFFGWNIPINNGCFVCYLSYLSSVYKSTFLNYYSYVILIHPRSMNELGVGLAKWMSWLAFTLLAKELRFDSQPRLEISLFSHAFTDCGAHSYFSSKCTGIFLPGLMRPRLKAGQLTSICNRSVECFELELCYPNIPLRHNPDLSTMRDLA